MKEVREGQGEKQKEKKRMKNTERGWIEEVGGEEKRKMSRGRRKELKE